MEIKENWDFYRFLLRWNWVVVYGLSFNLYVLVLYWKIQINSTFVVNIVSPHKANGQCVDIF